MMRVRTISIAAALTLCATNSAAHEWAGQSEAKPRSIAAFVVAEQKIEMRALTRRAQADTPLRREQLEESIEMNGVYPGYPQPAMVTIDFRVKF